MKEPTKVTLSVSSAKTVRTCQQKYWHYKVNQTPKDADYEEADSLSFGKAFHKVLEATLHTNWTDALVNEAMKEFNVTSDLRPLLCAMLENYVKCHRASKLKVVKCEMKIEIPGVYLGFIDFIAQDSDGWWFGDNKTAARHDGETLRARLHKDPQVNIYSSFAEDVGRALNMKGPFKGFRYRQSIKSKAKTPNGLREGTPTYDIIIPASILDPQTAWKEHLEAHELVNTLHQGAAPIKNHNSCFEYFRPCEFFSQCHGCLASEGRNEISILTAENLNDSDLLG